MQSFFTEEVAFAQRSNELFLERILRSDSDPNLTLRDDEESVASGSLTNDVVALLIIALLKHVRNLDERVFGKIFKDGNAERRKVVQLASKVCIALRFFVLAIEMRFNEMTRRFSTQCQCIAARLLFTYQRSSYGSEDQRKLINIYCNAANSPFHFNFHHFRRF